MNKFIKASHDKSIKTVQYLCDNGDILLRSGGTIAWRFNNPGNMRPKGKGTYPGQIGVGDTKSGLFVIFENYEIGRREKKALLRRSYNDLNLKNAIYKYAPPKNKYGGFENDTEGYINFLVEKTGIQRAAVLSTLSDVQINKLMDAMQQKEGFDNEKASRKEKVVKTTSISVSDGSQPLSDKDVKIKRSGDEKVYKTDKNGNLPPIAHKKEGEKVEVSVIDNGIEKLVGEFITGSVSQIFNLSNQLKIFGSKLVTQNGSFSNKKEFKVENYTYVVQPKDTLSSIAKRFKASTNQLKQWNHLKNINHIMVGQSLIIGGAKEHHQLQEKKQQNQTLKVQDNKTEVPNKNEKMQENQLTETRSKSNTGEGLAILPVSNKIAPWMAIAVREAKQWSGIKEGKITDNYHNLTGVKRLGEQGKEYTPTLANTAWCASFINYCMLESGFPNTKNPSSQFPVKSKHYVKIDKPVYGAIVVYKHTNSSFGTGHISLIFAELNDGDFAVLGGNQGDSITINTHKGVYLNKLKCILQGFYVPVAYYNHAKKALLADGDFGGKKYTLAEVKSLLNDKSGLATKTK